MIFLDTSAIYAAADARDRHHDVAKTRLRTILDSGEILLTHNYVVVESIALIQRRLGADPALRFAREVGALAIEWVDREIHGQAVRGLAAARGRQVSFVDQVSFLIMRSHRIDTALAFDDDFVAEGFRLYAAPVKPA